MPRRSPDRSWEWGELATVAPLRRLGTALDPVTRGWGVVVAGSAARLGLGFIASVLIARALGPADFGRFAALGAIATVVGAVADCGLTDAAVRQLARERVERPDTALESARAFVWLRLGAAVLVTTLAGLLALLLPSAILPVPARGPLLPLALLGVVATALGGAVSAILQALGQFGRLTLIPLSNAALTALLAVALFLTHRLTLVSALAVLGIGTSLAALALGYRLLPRDWHLVPPAVAALRAQGGTLFRFGRWVWLASSLALLAAQLDLLLLNHWRGAAVAGSYALALNIAAKADIVNSSLYTVLLPAAAALDGPAALRRYLRRGFLRSAAIGLALLPAIPLADPFITAFYGAAYRPAIPLCQLLLGVVIVDSFATPLHLLPYHYNRPRLLAGSDALRVAVLLALGTWRIPAAGAIGGDIGAVIARFGAKVAGMGVVIAGLRRVMHDE